MRFYLMRYYGLDYVTGQIFAQEIKERGNFVYVCEYSLDLPKTYKFPSKAFRSKAVSVSYFNVPLGAKAAMRRFAMRFTFGLNYTT